MSKIMKLAVATLTLILSPTTYANPTLYVAHGGGNAGAPFGGEIGTIDLTTGSYTTLTTLGSLTSLVWNGTSLYTFETQGNAILEIDPTTGAILSSVVLSGGPSALTDMAYDPTTGGYFGVGTDFNFYSLNVGTGVATFISGAVPGTGGGFRQIAFAADGTLYMHATNSPGQFFTINPATGAIISTVVGGVPGGALGLAVDPTTGLLIASECCGGSDGALGERLFSVDPGTGSPALLYDYDDSRRMQDFAFVNIEPDHYLCYDAKEQSGTPKFEKRNVDLEDQFGNFIDVEVKKPTAFCNPVDKNGEGINDATAHLTCYDIKQASGEPKLPKTVVQTEDQFGFLNLKIGSKAAKTLCVPSEKNDEESALRVDHFQLYKAKQESGEPDFEPVTVTLADQFGTFVDAEVKKPKHLGTPTDKNGEGILNEESHLTCYDVKQASGTPKLQDLFVHIANQFGVLDLKIGSKPKTLCLPATKEVVSMD